MNSQPTILDVASAAGVSRQTVSNVLNAPERVLPGTRERVEVAISELGYRPHASARRLRTRKSSTIGVGLSPHANGISGVVLDRFLHAVTEQAARRGLRVLAYPAIDPVQEIAQIAQLTDAADVDGFVLTNTIDGDPRLDWVDRRGVDFVTFGRPWGAEVPAHRWVDVDGRAGVAEATVSLLERGLRRIGFVGWPSPSGTGDDRRAGWESAMAAAGIDERTRAELTSASEDGVPEGAEAAGALWGSAGGVEALVCVSDSLALGALIRTGGRIPVIGFDDTPVASSIGFSSIEQPLDLVASSLLDLLGGSGDPHVLVTPKLVTRELASRELLLGAL